MTPEQWAEARRLFESSLQREPATRASFLEEATADPELREHVLSLLSWHERADGFLESPALTLGARGARPDAPEEPAEAGARLGPYRLVRELGRGGMGSVWRAERADAQYEQTVALKLVKRGMDSDLILERFRAERQILAGLVHPYIARLLDGGTTPSGHPYLVMEHVEGEPITEWCRARRLGVEERLGLFRRVAEAVQHAHQHLVVHRDLKPSNILVTRDGIPKLLDFGIAKVLSGDGGAQTALQDRLLTLEYASPEQVVGGPITTACDVYALGVLLYELLTSQSPYRLLDDAPEELARAVVEREPLRASERVRLAREGSGPDSATSLARRLRGDLDNVLAMALRKEPSRRYGSVEQLSEDVRRHLAGLPVLARPDTLSYRTLKFLGRNRLAIAVSLLLGATLAAGVVSTAVQRSRAERRFAEVRSLAHAVLFQYQDAVQALPGSTPIRERMVRDALTYLDSLSRDSGDDPGLEAELAAAYERVGQLQGNSYYSNLGDTRGALRSYRKSLALRERLAARSPADRAARRDVARSLEGLGDVQWTANDLAGARASYTRVARVLEGLAREDPRDRELKADLARFYVGFADLHGNAAYANLGETARAMELLSRSLDLCQALFDEDPRSLESRRLLSEGHYHAGEMRRVTGDAEGALASFEKARTTQEALLAEQPESVEPRRVLSGVHRYLAALREDRGEPELALAHLDQAVALSETLAAADATNVKRQRELAVSLRARAALRGRRGDARGSLEDAGKALALASALSQSGGRNADNRRLLLTVHDQLARSLARAGHPREAHERAQEALAEADALLAISPQNALARSDRAGVLATLAEADLQLGERREAIELLGEAVALREALARADLSNALARRDLLEAGRALAEARGEEARPR